MIIGVPKEIKNRENRVGVVPGGVEVLVKEGHTVNIEKGAGLGAGITDENILLQGRILSALQTSSGLSRHGHEGKRTYCRRIPSPEKRFDLVHLPSFSS